MIEIWPSIQIIFEKKELIEKYNEAIQEIIEQLGDKPCEATKFIKFLNSRKE